MSINLKEIIYLLFVRMPMTFWGRYVKHNLVKVHWGRGLNNFGDCLQPDTLRYYGLTPVYVPSIDKSDVIMAGSILQLIGKDYEGYIIGTGGDEISYSFQNARILAVRGELTRNKITLMEGVNNCELGDCGLLVKLVYPRNVLKKYRIGIVPHFVDLKNQAIYRLLKKYPHEILMISPLQKPSKVIEQIKSCKCILSSSLHGLIVADSFGIPSKRWVDRLTMPDVEFHDYKFKDYYSSLGKIHQPLLLTGYETIEELENHAEFAPKERVDQMIGQLDKAMRQFVNNVKHKNGTK